MKFQWFRLAGLEKLSSLQSMQLDEDLDKLDSASVLQVQAAAAAAAATGKFYDRGCIGKGSRGSTKPVNF